jgi:hypothetical protein
MGWRLDGGGEGGGVLQRRANISKIGPTHRSTRIRREGSGGKHTSGLTCRLSATCTATASSAFLPVTSMPLSPDTSVSSNGRMGGRFASLQKTLLLSCFKLLS